MIKFHIKGEKMKYLLPLIMALLLTGCVEKTPNPDEWATTQDENVLKSKKEIAQRAIGLLTPLCDDYNMQACNDLGASYEFLKEYEKAFMYYQKACDGKVELGCANVGILYENGLGVPKDGNRAIEIYKENCNKRGKNSCYHLGNAYRKGEIVERDYEQALNAYTLSCDVGVLGACANIGVMYEQGLGVQKDKKRAYNIYRVSCFRGLTKACTQMNRLADELGIKQ